MGFEVLNDFIEKGHNGTKYSKGEEYPKDGFIADPERVKFLQSDKNKYKKVFLGGEIKLEEPSKESPKESEKPKEKSKSGK